MLDLLSGRKTSVSFPRTASNGYILQETWTLLRKEPYCRQWYRHSTPLSSTKK